jgi:periplasmic protein TonB
MTTNKSPLAASLAIHIGLAIALFTIVSIPIQHPPVHSRDFTRIDLASYHRALKAPRREGGGGGGGRSVLPASKGQLPRQSPRPFTPPMIQVAEKEPVLLLEPALLTAPEMPAANLPQWGDPLSNNLIFSNGPGAGGGMGDGDKGGIGPGQGPGHGLGHGPGPGGPGDGGSAAVRAPFTAPKVLYQVDPEFSEEARRAKFYGTVILVVDVDTTGRAVNFRVAKSLGLGLDEKAMEAVARWKFRPAQRNGRPVTVPATIEVNFHLL